MISDEQASQLIKRLSDAVVNMDEDDVAAISNSIIAESIDPYRAVTEGLSGGMNKVGELYGMHQYFVPELLLCADAFYAGLAILKPHIKFSTEKIKTQKQIIVGVVEGDIHDIGKNLVVIMLEAAGWTVHDLGKDVQLGRFVEVQKQTNANIIALSALMTTSMSAMPKVIEMAKENNPNVLIMIGGAPITPEIADRYGADGYAKTADLAVREANRLSELAEKKQGS